MSKLKQYCNVIGEFGYTQHDLLLTGNLIFENDSYILKIKHPVKQINAIDKPVDLYGKIYGQSMYFFSCFCINMKYCDNFVYYTFEPNYIIWGDSFYLNTLIKTIGCNFPNLNYILSSIIHYDMANNISLSTENISHKLKNCIINIDHSLNINTSIHNVSVYEKYFASIMFNENCSIDKSLYYLAQLRNCLSVFADYDVQYEETYIVDSDNEKYYLEFNYSCQNDKNNHLFLINPDIEIMDGFSKYYEKWLSFVNVVKPISEILFDVFTDGTLRQNKYLNICQALELYSNTFRREEAKRLSVQKSVNSNKAPFHIKLLDMTNSIDYYRDNYLDLEIEQITILVASARHYYTHYNNDRFQPSFMELNYLIMFVRQLLLLLIYRYLGVPETDILDSIKKSRYNDLPSIVKKIIDNNKDFSELNI